MQIVTTKVIECCAMLSFWVYYNAYFRQVVVFSHCDKIKAKASTCAAKSSSSTLQHACSGRDSFFHASSHESDESSFHPKPPPKASRTVGAYHGPRRVPVFLKMAFRRSICSLCLTATLDSTLQFYACSRYSQKENYSEHSEVPKRDKKDGDSIQDGNGVMRLTCHGAWELVLRELGPRTARRVRSRISAPGPHHDIGACGDMG